MFKYLSAIGFFLILVGGAASNEAVRPGVLEGHLKIVSHKTVELADGDASTLAVETDVEYPLIVLSQEEKKVIARITADENGNYRVALPPGDYILDIQGRRARRRVRAKPQPFRVVSDQVIRVDMEIDTGIR